MPTSYIHGPSEEFTGQLQHNQQGWTVCAFGGYMEETVRNFMHIIYHTPRMKIYMKNYTFYFSRCVFFYEVSLMMDDNVNPDGA